jgi:hypothetical protein
VVSTYLIKRSITSYYCFLIRLIKMADKDAKDMSAAADDSKPAGKPTKQPWRPNKPVQQKKFEGDCEGMKGKILDCSDAKQADQFVQTCKALSIYVGSTFKNGGDMCTMILTLDMPTFPELVDPPEVTTRRRFDKLVDEQTKREIILDQNIRTLYSVEWVQCTEMLKNKLEALPALEAVSDDSNGLELLQ